MCGTDLTFFYQVEELTNGVASRNALRCNIFIHVINLNKRTSLWYQKIKKDFACNNVKTLEIEDIEDC